jgi:GNAT superfamily N-acetyltransferase/N-acetylglutamate synthase-like GNAT family acetyltransferase
MIEVRSFDGGYDQLAEFVAEMWRKNYEGRMPVPHWTSDFYARDGGPEEIAMDWSGAAYDGTRLVGVLPGWPISVQLHGRESLVRTGTGASVDVEYQRQGIGKLLNDWSMDHAREHGVDYTLFYLYDRTGQFKGSKFWKARGMPTELVCRLGQCVKPHDHAAVARWELWRFEAIAVRVLAPFGRRVAPPADDQAVREYRPEDLPACETLIRQVGDSMDLARRFDAEALARHLQFKDVAKTLVVEHEGGVAGFVNFCYLEILGRTLERFALVDLLAFDEALPHARRADLVRAALYQMKHDGMAASFMLRGSKYGGRALRAAGFLPVFPEYSLMAIKNREDVSLENVRSVLQLWR